MPWNECTKQVVRYILWYLPVNRTHSAIKISPKKYVYIRSASKTIKKGIWRKTLWLRLFALFGFSLKPLFSWSSIQSSHQASWTCTLLPASSIIYCHRQTVWICQMVVRAWHNTTMLRWKHPVCICQSKWQDREQRRQVVSYVLTKFFLLFLYLLLFLSLHPPSLW